MSSIHAYNNQEQSAMRTGLYVMLLAGMLGAAAISVLDSKKTYETVVQPTISEACAEPGSKKVDYHGKGLSVELAAGMLLSQPKKIQEICATINAAVGTYYVTNGNYLVNNIQVYALANVLGVDAKVANAAIEQEKLNRAVKEKKAEIQQPYGNSDFSGPNR